MLWLTCSWHSPVHAETTWTEKDTFSVLIDWFLIYLFFNSSNDGVSSVFCITGNKWNTPSENHSLSELSCLLVFLVRKDFSLPICFFKVNFLRYIHDMREHKIRKTACQKHNLSVCLSYIITPFINSASSSGNHVLKEQNKRQESRNTVDVFPMQKELIWPQHVLFFNKSTKYTNANLFSHRIFQV